MPMSPAVPVAATTSRTARLGCRCARSAARGHHPPTTCCSPRRSFSRPTTPPPISRSADSEGAEHCSGLPSHRGRCPKVAPTEAARMPAAAHRDLDGTTTLPTSPIGPPFTTAPLRSPAARRTPQPSPTAAIRVASACRPPEIELEPLAAGRSPSSSPPRRPQSPAGAARRRPPGPDAIACRSST